MASYYYSSDKKNWNRGGNEYEIFLKALVQAVCFYRPCMVVVKHAPGKKPAA